MGQYHLLVNLDKHEYVHPHRVGDGLKLREQVGNTGGTVAAACMLLACSNGRGGGDFIDHTVMLQRVIGRWAGDRIAWVGDYAEEEDLRPEDHASTIYDRCYMNEAEWEEWLDENGYNAAEYPFITDISELVAPLLEEEFGFEFTGNGWRHRRYTDGNTPQPAMAPDMIITFP